MNNTTTTNSYLLQGHAPGGIPTWTEDRRATTEEGGIVTIQILHLLPKPTPEGVFLTPGGVPSLYAHEKGKALEPSLIYDLDGNTVISSPSGRPPQGIHIAEYRIPFYELWGGGGKLPTITHTLGGDSYTQTMSHLSLPRNPFTVTMISSFRSEGLQYGTKTTHITFTHGNILSGEGLGVTFWVPCGEGEGTYQPGVKMYLGDFPFRGTTGSNHPLPPPREITTKQLQVFREAHVHRLGGGGGGSSKAEEAALKRKQERLAQLEQQYHQKTQPCSSSSSSATADTEEGQELTPPKTPEDTTL